MPCTQCGAEIPDDATFCPNCGERVGAPPKKSDPDPQTIAERLRGSDNDDDEEIDLWRGGYSAKAMIGNWIAGGIATVVLIVAAIAMPPSLPLAIGAILLIWIVLIGLVLYRKLSVRYELTSQRFIHKSGILKRVTDRIEVIDIDDVTFEQGLIQRLLGVGSIRITSSDRTHPELPLLGIDRVDEVANLIDEARRKERRRRGLHIEAI